MDDGLNISGDQLGSLLGQNIKSGSSAAADRALRGDRLAGRAMRATHLTSGQATAAFKSGYNTLKDKKLTRVGHIDAGEALNRSVHVAKEKGVLGPAPKSLHQMAEEKRMADRKESQKRERRRDENMAEYEKEKAAEEGRLTKEESNSVVRMVEHGVAAKLSEKSAVTAKSGEQKTGLAGDPGGATKKKDDASKSAGGVLPDIMF